MKITVEDIARKAKVSAATVSRALCANPVVSAEKTRRVLKAAKELGYSRIIAQGGRPRKSMQVQGNIALLIPDTNAQATHTVLMSKVACGAEKAASEEQFNFMLTHLRENNSLPPCIENRQVNGVLLRAGSEREILDKLFGIPRVCLFEPASFDIEGDVVQPDNERIGVMAYKHLRECQKLIVVGSACHPAAAARMHSFINCASAYRLKVEQYPDFKGIALETHLSAANHRMNTGIFFPTGENVLEELVLRLRELPQQSRKSIRVISCHNDQALVRALDPTIINIDINAFEIGSLATQTLLWRLKNPTATYRRILVAPKLVTEK